MKNIKKGFLALLVTLFLSNHVLSAATAPHREGRRGSVDVEMAPIRARIKEIRESPL